MALSPRKNRESRANLASLKHLRAWRDWHWPRSGHRGQNRTLIRRGRGMSSPSAKPRWPRLARAFDVDRPLYRGRVELSRRNRERRPPQSPHIGAQQAKDGLEQTSGSDMAARRRWWWRGVVRSHSPAEPSARGFDLHSCWLTLQRRSRCTRVCIAPEARCTRLENTLTADLDLSSTFPIWDFHRGDYTVKSANVQKTFSF